MKFLKRFGAILVKYDVDMINKVEYTFTFVIKDVNNQYMYRMVTNQKRIRR
jgi:hypothetical protein